MKDLRRVKLRRYAAEIWSVGRTVASLRLLRFAHPFGAASGWLSPFGRLTTAIHVTALRALAPNC